MYINKLAKSFCAIDLTIDLNNVSSHMSEDSIPPLPPKMPTLQELSEGIPMPPKIGSPEIGKIM